MAYNASYQMVARRDEASRSGLVVVLMSLSTLSVLMDVAIGAPHRLLWLAARLYTLVSIVFSAVVRELSFLEPPGAFESI
ncbi:hypothetical protein F4777DRAFT_527069 [Nemania sp. FL0916]|nr:hypothetical protein F4777DRAFT_527069 [Nemania sp. FL0916]